MKKKFIVTVTAVFGAFLGALCMAACNKDKGNGGGDEPDGPDEPTGVTYTVVFDANGGKFDAEFEIDGEVIDDGAVISSDGKMATYTVTSKELDEPLRMPERSQYAFSGWAKDTDGEVLWNFESDELDGDTTLYAVWATSFDFVRTDDGSGYIVRGIGGLSGDVEVPETHNGKPVTTIAKDAFKNSRSLTGIIIPDSVTEIGTGAFKNATKLESATIGEGVTVITNEVFCDCSALVELGLPKSLEKIEYDAFGTDGTRSLLEVKYAGGIDDWCGIEMDCSSDKKANPLSNGKAELYVNGRAVSEITINAETVNRWAFYRCKTIESVTIGKDVEEIGEQAFYQSEIEQLTFAQGSTLESIGASAFETNHMTTLTLPDSPVVLGESAFKDCNRLTALDLGGAVVLNDHAFDNCFMLSNINMRTVEYLGAGAFGGNSVLNEDGALSSVVIPATAWYIGRGCFGDQPALSSVTFASSATWKAYALRTDDPAETVTTDNLTGAAIYNKMKETRQWIRIAGTLTTSGGTVTGVQNKDGIGMLEVPKGVTKIAANAFKDFDGLRYLWIEADVTEIGDGFIDGCDDLMTVGVAVNNGAYASTGSIFYKKNGSILWINPSVTKTRFLTIPSGVKSIPSGMFAEMDVFSLTIPATVTEIADGAFADCKIEQAEIPACAAKHIINDKLRIVDIISGTEIEADAFKNCSSLEQVFLPDSLTTIGARAFENCGGLTSVNIPNGVTSISENAFAGCAIVLETEKTKEECAWSYDGIPVVYDRRHNDVADDGYVYAAIDGIRYALKDGKATVAKQSSTLTVVKIPASVEYKDTTYEVTGIADGAFDGCEIDRISVASGNSSISVYKGILYNADKTEIVLVPKGLKGSVTLADTLKSIPANAFAGMGITKITIPDSVTSIGENAFSGCGSLIVYSEATSKPSDWNIDWNKDACPVIWDCKNNDKDSNGYLYEVIDEIRYALKDGEATILTQSKNISGEVAILASVTRDNVVYSVTSIAENAFNGCGSITEIAIADSVKSIGARAFNGCGSITSITLGSGLKSIGEEAFGNCDALESITVSESNTEYASQDGILYNKAKTKISKVPKRLKGSVTIPNGVTSIGQYMFYNCSAITNITIGNSVTSIGDQAFYGCSSIASITVPNSVKSIGEYAFGHCDSLTTITIGSGVTEIFTNAFYDSPLLESIIVSKDNTTYASQDGILYNKEKMELRYVPPAISGDVSIPDGITSIPAWLFSICVNNLTSVTIPNSVTLIGGKAFENCHALTIYCEAARKPDGWSSNWNYYGCYVVWDCTNNTKTNSGYEIAVIDGIRYLLRDGKATIAKQPSNITTANIPATVTYKGTVYNVTIEDEYQPFAFCKSLTSITIANGITRIGDKAFYGYITSITFDGTMAQWNAIEKGQNWDYGLGNCPIHCTDGDIAKS